MFFSSFLIFLTFFQSSRLSLIPLFLLFSLSYLDPLLSFALRPSVYLSFISSPPFVLPPLSLLVAFFPSSLFLVRLWQWWHFSWPSFPCLSQYLFHFLLFHFFHYFNWRFPSFLSFLSLFSSAHLSIFFLPPLLPSSSPLPWDINFLSPLYLPLLFHLPPFIQYISSIPVPPSTP